MADDKKNRRNSEITLNNKIKRVARNHPDFNGPVANPQNHKNPSEEARKFVNGLGIKFRVSTSKGK
jgi:hypothetical protein